MKQKLLVGVSVLSLIIVVLMVGNVAAANNSAETIESDYAHDINLGEEQLKSDPEASAARQEVEQSEKPEAQVGAQTVQPIIEIRPEEAVESTNDLLPNDTQIVITPEPEPQNEPTPTGSTDVNPNREVTETPVPIQ